jgi:hypothetical protein
VLLGLLRQLTPLGANVAVGLHRDRVYCFWGLFVGLFGVTPIFFYLLTHNFPAVCP